MLRLLFKSLTLLIKQNWAKTSTTLHRVLAYPRTPVHGKPEKSFGYSFLQIPPGSEPEVIETDVIVVGSGCGGGVVAKNVAEAGHRILVADKGYHWPSEHLPMTEDQGWSQLFYNGGFITCMPVRALSLIQLS
jgi:NADPH-dependent 2,4-dienoyl-CoA reductase/sulfur reductase-like enzyme